MLPVTLTTCEQLVHMYETHAPYAEVIGKYVCHDGQAVWVKLNGCDSSDNHEITHRHNIPEYMDKMFNGKIVRLLGERSWDSRARMWGYRWTLHSVNLWEESVQASPASIKALCGTNC